MSRHKNWAEGSEHCRDTLNLCCDKQLEGLLKNIEKYVTTYFCIVATKAKVA